MNELLSTKLLITESITTESLTNRVIPLDQPDTHRTTNWLRKGKTLLSEKRPHPLYKRKTNTLQALSFTRETTSGAFWCCKQNWIESYALRGHHATSYTIFNICGISLKAMLPLLRKPTRVFQSGFSLSLRRDNYFQSWRALHLLLSYPSTTAYRMVGCTVGPAPFYILSHVDFSRGRKAWVLHIDTVGWDRSLPSSKPDDFLLFIPLLPNKSRWRVFLPRRALCSFLWFWVGTIH